MEFCSTNGRLLPGFRFHPMDVELVMYYLKRKVLGKRLQPEVIVEIDIYLFHPRDLPEFSHLKKDLNWYFFCPRGKKYGSGERTNRATQTGYWKATGNDRDVAYEGRSVGKIKTLIFHQGKAPKGERTDWVLHEYRLEDEKLADEGVCQDSYVLCKIFKKSGLGPKNGEQYGAPFIEEEWDELEDNDEIPICTEVLPIEAQNQCASAVTVNASPSSISKQVYTEENSGANVALSSVVLARDYDDSVDQGLPPMSFAPNWASSAEGLSPNYCCDPLAQGFGLMSNAAVDIASSSYAPPNFDDDEINRMLDCFERDEFREIFDILGDLDHDAAQGVNKSAMMYPYESGLDLTDLDAPL